MSYLDSKDVREWFASHDLRERRDEGVQWVESMTTDDMRVAARDLLIMNRVIASWAPKSKQTSVAVEALSTGNLSAPQPTPSRRGTRGRGAAVQGEGPIVPFPSHKDSPLPSPLPEIVTSGVSIVPSVIDAVFISGGPLARFDHEPTSADLRPFQKYRANRILVLTRPASIDRARQLWSSFTGSSASTEIGVPKGKVSSGDLPALFILKTILDLKVIESGWWRDVQLRIDASDGSGLQILADDDQRAQILDWIKAIAAKPPGDPYFTWVREVAIHHFDAARADLQALTWERDPQGTIQDLETISPNHVQDVARIYF